MIRYLIIINSLLLFIITAVYASTPISEVVCTEGGHTGVCFVVIKEQTDQNIDYCRTFNVTTHDITATCFGYNPYTKKYGDMEVKAPFDYISWHACCDDACTKQGSCNYQNPGRLIVVATGKEDPPFKLDCYKK